MKIAASLLRPIVDITADGDLCINAKLSGSVHVPPVKVDVSPIPVAMDGAVSVPDVAINVGKIPIHMGATVKKIPITLAIPAINAGIHVEAVIFGVHIETNHITTGIDAFTIQGSVGPIAAQADGTLGEITASTHMAAPIDVDVKGSLGGFTAQAQMPEPIAMNLDGCVKGVARLNPENLQLPKCCEGYKPVVCSCHIHKDHAYCEKQCPCSHHQGG